MRKIEHLNTLNNEELKNLIIEQDNEIQKLNGFLEKVFRERVINEASEINNGDYSKSNNYIQSWDVITKILFVIDKTGRPLQSSDLLSYLIKYDEKAKYWSNKAGTLSTFLNRAMKYERIIAHKIPGKKGYYYFLPAWLNEHGELSSEYKIKAY